MKTFLDKFVHEKGRRFHAALLPDDIERGEIGECFDHCLLQALKSNGRYRYCEGKALYDGKWYHHAWLTDRESRVAFDPTWRAVRYGEQIPLKIVEYVGAELPLDDVVAFVIRTSYKSPLANYKKDPELAQKIYDMAH